MPYTPAGYSKILIEEGLTERLLEYCRSNIREIENLYPHLINEYYDEVEQLFAEHIREEAARSGSRSHYKQVCGTIRRYKKLFGQEKAAQIVLELKNRYRRRPAFIDELSGFEALILWGEGRRSFNAQSCWILGLQFFSLQRLFTKSKLPYRFSHDMLKENTSDFEMVKFVNERQLLELLLAKIMNMEQVSGL